MSTKPLPNLGNWPSNWRNSPLWAMFERIKDIGHPDEEMLSVYRAHGVVKKSSRDDNFNQTAENRNIYQLIDKGWFVVNRMKAWQGAVGISALRGIVSGHYLCFRPKHNEEPRFLNWLLRSGVYSVEYARMSRGVRPGQIEIDNDELRGLRLALPPLDEQRRIADFLDSETNRLDFMAQRRLRQRDLLDELARSTIDDGIATLNKIAWVRLGYLAVVQSGVTVDGSRRHEGNVITMPYLRVANVQSDHVDLSEVSEISVPRETAAASRLQVGDVLMTEGGDLDKLGRGTVWRGEIPDCLHQNHVFAVRPDVKRLMPEYLALLTRASFARSYFESTGNKTTNLASTSSSKIRDFQVPLAKISDQQRITEEVTSKIASISEASGKMSRQLSLLAEHRQALIIAAVTGQIDVTTARGVSERDGEKV